MSEFTQLCVMPNAVLGNNTPQQFEEWFKSKGFTVKFAEEVELLPKSKRTKERHHDILFYIASEDIIRFSVQKIMWGFRWWEDVVKYNDYDNRYPKEVLDRYPVTW